MRQMLPAACSVFKFNTALAPAPRILEETAEKGVCQRRILIPERPDSHYSSAVFFPYLRWKVFRWFRERLGYG